MPLPDKAWPHHGAPCPAPRQAGTACDVSTNSGRNLSPPLSHVGGNTRGYARSHVDERNAKSQEVDLEVPRHWSRSPCLQNEKDVPTRTGYSDCERVRSSLSRGLAPERSVPDRPLYTRLTLDDFVTAFTSISSVTAHTRRTRRIGNSDYLKRNGAVSPCSSGMPTRRMPTAGRALASSRTGASAMKPYSDSSRATLQLRICSPSILAEPSGFDSARTPTSLFRMAMRRPSLR